MGSQRNPLYMSAFQWNERHPVGTRVAFRNIFGVLVRRRTSAGATMLGDGCAWVSLGGAGLHACRGLTVVDESMTTMDALAVLGDVLRGSRVEHVGLS